MWHDKGALRHRGAYPATPPTHGGVREPLKTASDLRTLGPAATGGWETADGLHSARCAPALWRDALPPGLAGLSSPRSAPPPPPPPPMHEAESRHGQGTGPAVEQQSSAGVRSGTLPRAAVAS